MGSKHKKLGEKDNHPVIAKNESINSGKNILISFKYFDLDSWEACNAGGVKKDESKKLFDNFRRMCNLELSAIKQLSRTATTAYHQVPISSFKIKPKDILSGLEKLCVLRLSHKANSRLIGFMSNKYNVFYVYMIARTRFTCFDLR